MTVTFTFPPSRFQDKRNKTALVGTLYRGKALHLEWGGESTSKIPSWCQGGDYLPPSQEKSRRLPTQPCRPQSLLRKRPALSPPFLWWMEDSPSIAILEWGTGGSLGEGTLPRPPADHGSLYRGRGAHLGSAVCAVGEGSRGQQRGADIAPGGANEEMAPNHQTHAGRRWTGAAAAASCQGGKC